MPITVKAGGVYRSSHQFAKTGGRYRSVHNAFVKVGGVYRPVYSYHYTTSGWSSCSASCGGGWQSRNINCTRNDGVVMSDNFCSHVGLGKPSSSQSCNTHGCYGNEATMCSNRPGCCGSGAAVEVANVWPTYIFYGGNGGTETGTIKVSINYDWGVCLGYRCTAEQGARFVVTFRTPQQSLLRVTFNDTRKVQGQGGNIMGCNPVTKNRIIMDIKKETYFSVQPSALADCTLVEVRAGGFCTTCRNPIDVWAVTKLNWILFSM